MLYEFHSKKNATQATNSICLVYGDLADLNDKDRPGRPIEANDSLLEKLFEQDRRKSTKISKF